ncbi:MAG TPA: tetratricopeptide repeat protein [Nitrosopumilaceae archaeon]|nr:tetratricopeptide repeat protein [Nitrosopumilaceae archaeon]
MSSFTPRFALAEGDDISETILISTDKLSYFTNEPIVISGEVTTKKMPVIALKIFDPDDNILGAYSVEINETNHFSKTITADVPFYEKPGIYTITADYGKLKTETFFGIESGPGENTDSAPNVEESPTILPQVKSFETDKKRYSDEDTIFASGKVSTLSDGQVTVTIFDPNRVPVGIYLANVSPDLTFSTSFLARYHVNFKVEGTYSLTAQYGGPETKQEIEIEFFEKQNQSNSTTPESNTPESNTPSSFLFSESDLNDLANWYYLDGSDNQLAQFFKDLLKRGLINPNVDGVVSKDVLVQWIQDTKVPLGTLVDDLFSGNISEKEFMKSVENSLRLYINKSSEPEPVINVSDTSQTKNIPTVEEPEIKKPSRSNNKPARNIDVPLETTSERDTGTVYFYSSVNCQKNAYEDIIAYYNNPGPALARLCKYEDAIFNYDQTLQSDPKNIHALTNKGAALSSLGRYQEAITYYDKALEINPHDTAALNNREKTSAFLVTYSTHGVEPKTMLISEEPPSHIENKPLEKIEKHDDIVTQLSNVFSSIGVSLMSLFGG